MARVERLECDDPAEPYLVCSECANRLHHFALRPFEWFNLASRYGWQKYLLHDDFYDQDGTAVQPDIEGYSASGMLAPSLNDVALSPERLIDFCITRWWLGDAEYEALRALPSEELFTAIKQRATTGNSYILSVALYICANVFGSSAKTWVNDQYERACREDELVAWAYAAARCLPQREGLEMTANALEKYSGRDLIDRIGALSWFRSPAVLDWIELNVPDSGITECWGRLAALSGLTWDRVQTWLNRGRPLSLVALDSLNQFMNLPRHAPIVSKLRPALLGNPDRATIIRALQIQLLNDTAPRSVKSCEYLIEHVEKIHVSHQT